MRLKGRVAVITGGASGIGQATARIFARAGARGVVCCHVPVEDGARTAAAIEKAGGDAVFMPADVADSAQVRGMVEKTVEIFGGIDVLVNAAAALVYGTALQIDEDCWNRVLAINLTATFLCAKAVLPHMIRRGGGSIIQFSSTAGALDAIEHGVAYGASKGGVRALAKAMAIDHARRNIRVNSICPGPIDTPVLRKALSPGPRRNSPGPIRWKGRAGPRNWPTRPCFSPPTKRLLSPDPRCLSMAAIRASVGVSVPRLTLARFDCIFGSRRNEWLA